MIQNTINSCCLSAFLEDRPLASFSHLQYLLSAIGSASVGLLLSGWLVPLAGLVASSSHF